MVCAEVCYSLTRVEGTQGLGEGGGQLGGSLGVGESSGFGEGLALHEGSYMGWVIKIGIKLYWQ